METFKRAMHLLPLFSIIFLCLRVSATTAAQKPKEQVAAEFSRGGEQVVFVSSKDFNRDDKSSDESSSIALTSEEQNADSIEDNLRAKKKPESISKTDSETLEMSESNFTRDSTLLSRSSSIDESTESQSKDSPSSRDPNSDSSLSASFESDTSADNRVQILYQNRMGELVQAALDAACPCPTCCGPPPPLKCCDSACPKCLGIGPVPPPNNPLCNNNCKGGICGNECPCDACVCCFTDTTWVTETSTCLNLLFSTTIETATQTQVSIVLTTVSSTSAITFSVTTNFYFTSIDFDTVTGSVTTTNSLTFTSFNTVSTTFYFFTETSFQTALIVETSTIDTVVVGTTTTVFTTFLPTELTTTFTTPGVTSITITTTTSITTTTTSTSNSPTAFSFTNPTVQATATVSTTHTVLPTNARRRRAAALSTAKIH